MRALSLPLRLRSTQLQKHTQCTEVPLLDPDLHAVVFGGIDLASCLYIHIACCYCATSCNRLWLHRFECVGDVSRLQFVNVLITNCRTRSYDLFGWYICRTKLLRQAYSISRRATRGVPKDHKPSYVVFNFLTGTFQNKIHGLSFMLISDCALHTLETTISPSSSFGAQTAESHCFVLFQRLWNRCFWKTVSLQVARKAKGFDAKIHQKEHCTLHFYPPKNKGFAPQTPPQKTMIMTKRWVSPTRKPFPKSTVFLILDCC